MAFHWLSCRCPQEHLHVAGNEECELLDLWEQSGIDVVLNA